MKKKVVKLTFMKMYKCVALGPYEFVIDICAVVRDIAIVLCISLFNRFLKSKMTK